MLLSEDKQIIPQICFDFVLFIEPFKVSFTIDIFLTFHDFELRIQLLGLILKCFQLRLAILRRFLGFILNPLRQLLIVSLEVCHALLSILCGLLLLIVPDALQAFLLVFETTFTFAPLNLQSGFLICQELYLVIE